MNDAINPGSKLVRNALAADGFSEVLDYSDSHLIVACAGSAADISDAAQALRKFNLSHDVKFAVSAARYGSRTGVKITLV